MAARARTQIILDQAINETRRKRTKNKNNNNESKGKGFTGTAKEEVQ